MKKLILNSLLLLSLFSVGGSSYQQKIEYDLTEPWLYTVEFVGQEPTNKNVYNESIQEFLRIDLGYDVEFVNIGNKSNDYGQASYHVVIRHEKGKNVSISFEN